MSFGDSITFALLVFFVSDFEAGPNQYGPSPRDHALPPPMAPGYAG